MGVFSKLILGVVAIIVFGSILRATGWKAPDGSGRGTGLVNAAIAEMCRTDKAKLEKIRSFWTQHQLIRDLTITGEGNSRLIVEDSLWLAAPHDIKVTIALVSYCAGMNPNGTGVALVKGYRDGAVKASVVDGDYSD